MEAYDREMHGDILWSCTYSECYMRSVSLFYVLLSVFWMISLSYLTLWDYMGSAVVFLISVWRIYRVHRAVVLVCENKILFSIPVTAPTWRWMAAWKTLYMSFDYEEIVGVSEDWKYLFLGERRTGGIVEAPVQMSFLSSEDKETMQEWIQKKKDQEP